MTPASSEENYDFCNDMDKYITNDVMIENSWKNPNYTNYCIFSETEFSEKETEYEEICAKFKRLFNLLFDESSPFSSIFNHSDIYINFWLNYQLKNINPSSDIVQRFYEVLTSTDPSFDIHKKLQGKIQNIQDRHLENLKIFYYLYSMYNAIHTIIQDDISDRAQCASYSKECAQKYEEAIKKCPKDTSSNFCEALNVFKRKYEQLKESIKINNCELEVLKPLPSHQRLREELPLLQNESPEPAKLDNILGEQEDSKDFSTATAASGTMIGMFFTSLILYKSTPLGPWLRNRILKKNIMGKNIEDEEKNHELLLHMSEYHDINSEDNMYQIPYTSL
ncbi:PIR Superfamily Protein [Plasmodium ovale wallikeri]|uniref:PIR Superfamily Protein n=1 Tax=Plasmodium ovale wallikeri TaxID=864142 RepID=A0A1A9AGJ7_PLAOA|nr:PIR Superfamily Protein [Plasmodium ovale wallikeri]SBT59183.1 PIR Superfamily Protein [Plasmodium ovale wallikeri]